MRPILLAAAIMSATALPAAAQSFNITPDHDGTGSYSGSSDNGDDVSMSWDHDGTGGFSGSYGDQGISVSPNHDGTQQPLGRQLGQELGERPRPERVELLAQAAKARVGERDRAQGTEEPTPLFGPPMAAKPLTPAHRSAKKRSRSRQASRATAQNPDRVKPKSPPEPALSLPAQRRRQARQWEWHLHVALAERLTELLDPGCVWWTSIDNQPWSLVSGIMRKKRGCRAGTPDILLVCKAVF